MLKACLKCGLEYETNVGHKCQHDRKVRAVPRGQPRYTCAHDTQPCPDEPHQRCSGCVRTDAEQRAARAEPFPFPKTPAHLKYEHRNTGGMSIDGKEWYAGIGPGPYPLSEQEQELVKKFGHPMRVQSIQGVDLDKLLAAAPARIEPHVVNGQIVSYDLVDGSSGLQMGILTLPDTVTRNDGQPWYYAPSLAARASGFDQIEKAMASPDHDGILARIREIIAKVKEQ